MKTFEELTGLYSLKKTLRFELKPLFEVGQIEQKMIERDERRSISASAMKDLMNDLHRKFINQVLRNLPNKKNDETEEPDETFHNGVLSIYEKYSQNDNAEELYELQSYLRKYISDIFTSQKLYADMFNDKNKNRKIIERLKEYIDGDEEKTGLIKQFDGFIGYFDGFFKNRKNMYVAQDIPTAIPYRIVNQNLPKFINNIRVLEKLQSSEISKCVYEAYTDFEQVLNVNSLEELFSLDNYVNCICQSDIDAYNYVIGGMQNEKTTTLIKGLNQYISQYNQTHPKSERLPLFKPLYKQILTEREKVNWLPEEFSSDAEMLCAIKDKYCNINDSIKIIHELLCSFNAYDKDGIFIKNDESLSLLSQRIAGHYSIIKESVINKWATENPKKKRETDVKYNQRKSDCFSNTASFCISHIEKSANIDVTSYFMQMAKDDNGDTIFDRIDKAYEKVLPVLEESSNEKVDIVNNDGKVELIRIFLDSIKQLQAFIRPLRQSDINPNANAEFYNSFDSAIEILDEVVDLYNKVRNRLTRKPYKDEKFQLFFDCNSKLLGGWTDSKTKSNNGTQYGGYLFRKKNDINEYDYYLGISSDAKLFRSFNNVDDNEKSAYERLNYYQLGSKTFYGGCFTTAVGVSFSEDKEKMCSFINRFANKNGSAELKTAIEKEELKAAPKIDTPSGFLAFVQKKDDRCYHNLIVDDEYKQINNEIILHIQTTMASTPLSSLKECAQKKYTSFVDAMDDVERFCKSDKVFDYFHVSESEMTRVINRQEKRLYLFKITNKDLSYADNRNQRKSRGRDNLHTMYFKALMGGNNSLYDIGSGTVYFRRKTDGLRKEIATHPKNTPIKNKNPKTVEKKSTSVFSYDIQKDDRYTRDAFKLHLSMMMNFSKGKPDQFDINNKILSLIHNGNIKHIIGIDRGERHLLYITVIDMKGNLVHQESLNIINQTDYQYLLSERMKERDENRKSWKHINNIKNLKEGYLSQVVHKITSMILEYDAVVFLENLNGGFIRGRQKIEKQVYQQFEKTLIDKLNFYVEKSKPQEELGGIFNPIQLTYPYDNNTCAEGQNGVLFYIPAWNTSKIDPVTGFVNLLDTRYKDVKTTLEFFSKFDSIKYNADKDWFEFALDYSKFTTKADGTQTKWTLCTYGTRERTFRNAEKLKKWDNEPIEKLTEEFKKLFNAANIDIHGNLKESICSITDKKHLETLMHLMKLLLQMRNSITKSEVDYLLSPVADENGNFYDSRTCSEALPKDADANGAYNIARKGLWCIRQIKESAEGVRPNLAISNKDWLQFAQQKPYLND